MRGYDQVVIFYHQTFTGETQIELSGATERRHCGNKDAAFGPAKSKLARLG
jgi:hypothetical protein